MKIEITKIREAFKDYIVSNNLKSCCIGISGGLDSAVNAALLYPVCQELGIPMIGRYIHIDSNKECELNTAQSIGIAFCDSFKCVNLTNIYTTFSLSTEGVKYDDDIACKIRNGNIKARMRMIYLRDLVHLHSGIMIDNSNYTEWNLGFFTIADGGDYSPLFYYWKTEVYQIARELLNECNEEQQVALQKAIGMIPTDGLGISSSDLEQIGAESYEQVDSILQEILRLREKNANKGTILEFFYDHSGIDYDIVTNIVNRHFNSEFKRKQLPIKITRDEI